MLRGDSPSLHLNSKAHFSSKELREVDLKLHLCPHTYLVDFHVKKGGSFKDKEMSDNLSRLTSF